MILKTCFFWMLVVAWEVSGASFSKVFVQTGPEVAPALEYLQYGAPSYTYGSLQVPKYNSAPVAYEYPSSSSYGYATPCHSGGCFYPGQNVATVPQVAPSADVVEYKAPVSSLPLVYSPAQNGPSGYEYSYVIVDQRSGDQKVHSELSDAGIVRGEYSFLQPDGLIRAVQYVADDTQGFKAIVENFAPNEEVIHTEVTHHVPCHDGKSGALTAHESHHEHYEVNVEHHGGHEHHPDHEAHESEARHGSLEHHEPQELHEEHNVEDHEARHGSENHQPAHEEHEVEDHEARHGIHEHQPKHDEPEVEEHVDHEARHKIHENHNSHEENGEDIEVRHGEHHEHSEHVHESEDHKTSHEEESKESESHHAHQHTPHANHATHENLIEISHSESHQPHETQATHEPGVAGSNVYVSYNDIIKCIQAAMTKVNTHPSIPRPPSPLTYLVFNKSC